MVLNRWIIGFVLAGLLIGTAFLPLSAQTSFGRISGTITDTSGEAIAGARVVARNTDTQDTREVRTENTGFYIFTDLPVGTYSVEVEQEGFRRMEQTGINLAADGSVTANFKIEVGKLTQSIEVVATQAETLNTTSGELSRVIDQKQVENLALNGRNYSELLTLVPGSIVTNPDQFSVTTSLSATNQVINGNRGNSNNLTVDGAFNMDAGSNGSLINNVSADFIQEVKIATSNFSAEYGRMSGAAFNIVTKGGTNVFHGGAFEYFRNDALDARNFFAPNRTELRFNDFGYDVGGPVIKNKLFFFAGEEWKRLRQQLAPTRQTLPSNAQLAGNFKGQKQLHYPGTKTAIPGNMIPPSRLTPDGRAIANIYKYAETQAILYNDSAISNNATFEGSNPLNYREDLVRLDYRMNDKHSMYGRYIQDYNTIVQPYGTGSNTNVPVFPDTRYRPGKSWLISETWLPTPTIVNEARVSATWNSQYYKPEGTNWLRSTYGFQYPQLYSGGQYDNGIPAISISGFSSFDSPSEIQKSPTTDIQFSDTVTIVRGSHTIKAGVLVIRNRKDQNGQSPYAGDITFSTGGNTNTSGNALADTLMGNFRTYTEASYDPFGFFRFTEPEAFVQDAWRVSRKLSLDLGVRYEYFQPIYTQGNNLANFDPAFYDFTQAVRLTPQGQIVAGSGNPYNGLVRAGNGVPNNQQARVPNATDAGVLGVASGAPRGLYQPANTFGPRIGFAYSADGQTVLRGGFGIYYNRPDGNITFPELNNPPYTSVNEFENSNLSNISRGSTGAFGDIESVHPHLVNSYSEQFSISIQRGLPAGIFLETSYVGTLGRHLLRRPDINQPSFEVLAANAALPSSKRATENYLRPYAGYSAIYDYTSDSTSNYHALQVYVSKRKGNVVATGGFTWSKALGDSSSETDNPENYWDRHYNYGPTSFDRRYAFVGTYVWRLPRLDAHNALLRLPLGGWQLSGIVRLQSGGYYTVTGSTAIGTRRYDYTGGDVLVADPGPNGWINKVAFAAPPASRYGSSGVRNVSGPGLETYNLSLAKFFRVNDRVSLRFQGDFFNAFNITNWNVLNTAYTNGSFGTVTSAYPARQIQLGTKLQF
jgi:hypothetical protein